MSASFVVPNCCIGLVQFHFDVLISMYLFWLLSVAKFCFVDRASRYIYQLLYRNSIPPDDGLQISPKGVEVD
jgi:hypothetical protein